MPSVAQLIRGYSRRYGIDPRAALAVAMTEGGLRRGAVGDQGTSFGPFQLHVGGALPRGRGARWANSPAGIEYAIRKMSESGARGLRGRQAIASIVRNFERPADPGSEIAKALGYYGNVGGGGRGGAALPPATPGRAPAGGMPTVDGDPRRQLAMALLQRVRGDEQAPDVSGIVQLFRQSQSAPSGGSAGLGPVPPGGAQPSQGGPAGGAAAMIQAIRRAQQMGLRVSENPYVDKVDPVHVENSWHYRRFPGRRGVGRGLDVSGSPELLRRYAQWLIRNRAREQELFYDPLGGRYRIGGHGTHVHVAY